MRWQSKYIEYRNHLDAQADALLEKDEKKQKRKQRKERKKRKEKGYRTFGLNDKRWQNLRRRVFNAYGKVCMKCGSTDELHVDHIKPKSKYPKLAYDFDNLQVLCKTCNYEKSNKTCDDFREKFEQEEYELSMLANMPDL